MIRSLVIITLLLLPGRASAQSGLCGLGALLDGDGDGYVSFDTLGLCEIDCDDSNPQIFPGAAETCGDGVDQDCDGIDTPCVATDGDGDGFDSLASGGDDCDDTDILVHPGQPEICGDGKDNDCNGGDAACLPDGDGDGYGDLAAGGSDCNDGDPSVHPHAPEICGDGVDQDCAGGDPACADDIDGDGYLNPQRGGNDCDDFDAATHPGATDLCGDGRDQDCDGQDAGCGDIADADQDGYEGVASGGTDCNDNDPAVHPGAAERCGDGVDQDCDGRELTCGATAGDGDGDGHVLVAAGGDDCNDNDAAVHPGAVEICDDGIDQDCDGRDASFDVDAICDDSRTTNPAFDQGREGAAVRTTAPAAEGCAQLPVPLPLLACILAMALLGRRRRQR